ncbi:hypothetical protein RRG08_058786 [Elysia crispata]|uniref:Uncharacterized protein n=1 Tax=Elysia crispata TaxID=231223 RepID=A0AAE0YXT9_9GAST|nr:hypothetical protein RRG08_058786 [Elysia crispata]
MPLSAQFSRLGEATKDLMTVLWGRVSARDDGGPSGESISSVEMQGRRYLQYRKPSSSDVLIRQTPSPEALSALIRKKFREISTSESFRQTDIVDVTLSQRDNTTDNGDMACGRVLFLSTSLFNRINSLILCMEVLAIVQRCSHSCVLFDKQCRDTLHSCVLFDKQCHDTLHSCVLFDKQCRDTLHSCVLFDKQCRDTLHSCVLFDKQCRDTLHSCVLFDKQCHDTLHSCVLFDKQCRDTLHSCVLFDKQCRDTLHSCVLFDKQCRDTLHSCVLFDKQCRDTLHSCVLFDKQCRDTLHSCVLFD